VASRAIPITKLFPPDVIKEAAKVVRAVESPVLAVVRGSISAEAGALLQVADLILTAHDAVLPIGSMGDEHNDTLTGEQALRLGYITWSVTGSAIDAEMTRILDMLRGKSAVALRLTKASIRPGRAHSNSNYRWRCRGTLRGAQASQRVLSFKGHEYG